jgi:peroxiredoxin-like protein
MHALPHRYRLMLDGGPDGRARVASAGLPDLESSPPAEFDGPGDRWSPEHMLVAAVLACFLFTLRGVARASKIEFTQLHCKGEGVLDRQEGGYRFIEVILQARVSVPAGTDREKAKRVIEKSERACLISRSLACPVRLEAEVAQA